MTPIIPAKDQYREYLDKLHEELEKQVNNLIITTPIGESMRLISDPLHPDTARVVEERLSKEIAAQGYTIIDARISFDHEVIINFTNTLIGV